MDKWEWIGLGLIYSTPIGVAIWGFAALLMRALAG